MRRGRLATRSRPCSTSATNPAGRGITAGVCAGVDVAVDVTRADAVLDNLTALAAHGISTVVGATGLAGVRNGGARRSHNATASACWRPPNFSLGANLLAVLAERAAELLRAARGLRGVHPRAAPRGKARRPVRDGADAARASWSEAGYTRPIDVLVDARGRAFPAPTTWGSTVPPRRSRDAHGARPRDVRSRRARRPRGGSPGDKGWFTMRDVLGTV